MSSEASSCLGSCYFGGINLKLLKDSKKITFKKRENIFEHIKQNSYFAIGIASVEEILKLNILHASLLSMKRAINQLTIKPDITLIDGNYAPAGIKNYKTIVNGDEKVKAISAASIIAKVYRDRLMIKLSEKFSNYAWDRNFGYGTKGPFKGSKKIWYNLPIIEKVLNQYTRYCRVRISNTRETLFLK